MVKIKARRTLRGQLREMPIGESAEITLRKTGYSPQRVREACHRLKQEGYLYECTEKGMVDAIRVTRLQ